MNKMDYVKESHKSNIITDTYVEYNTDYDTFIDSADRESNKMDSNAKIAPIIVDYESLKVLNKDFVGWIYMPDSKINYPILQGEDNNEYLHKLIDGSEQKAGSLFLDYRCKNDLSDSLNLIYGHNVKDETMFACLEDFKKQNFYDNHKEIWILTQNQCYKVRIISSYVTNTEDEIYLLNTQIGKEELEKIVEKSDFNIDEPITFSGEEKLFVLSTCSYETEQSRYIVWGIVEQ